MNKANYEELGPGHRTTSQELVIHPPGRFGGDLYPRAHRKKDEGRYAQAEEYYRKAIQVAPQFDEAFSNLGNVYFARKQTDLAIASYQQAIELNPEQGSLLLQPLPGLFPRNLSFRKDRPGLPEGEAASIPRLVEYYTSIDTPPHPNRLVIDEVLSPESCGTGF